MLLLKLLNAKIRTGQHNKKIQCLDFETMHGN